MKIVVGVRTLNEEKNIDRFCQSYTWADQIIIADGGSTDKTIRRAAQYKNTTVHHFRQRVQVGDQFRNPYGKHINYLINKAAGAGADWFIFDDADCVPTVRLQQALRTILTTCPKPVVTLYRLYVWGHDKYFPDMNKAGQSLYAWQLPHGIRAWEGHDLRMRLGGWDPEDEYKLERPFCCLHYFYPDEGTVKRKQTMRQHFGIRSSPEPHPLHSFGPLESLPPWAIWNKDNEAKKL